MKARQFGLFDDGQCTYQSHQPFSWNGAVQKTPFGAAAYVGAGTPRPPATGRIGGFFGVPNGRTWSQLFAIRVYATAAEVPYDLNAQDVIQVRDELGGGYAAWGRHDLLQFRLSPLKVECPFGPVFARRISNSEAKEVANSYVPTEYRDAYVTPSASQIALWDLTGSWADEYRGPLQFHYERVLIQGSREQLLCPGAILPGWSFEHDELEYTGILETLTTSDGRPFATRLSQLQQLHRDVANV